MDLNRHLKELQRLTSALKKLSTAKNPLRDQARADTLGEAIAAAKSLDINELRTAMEQTAEDVEKNLRGALDRRRESLLTAARDANLFQKRFGEFDRVGPFKVSYRGKKVLLETGSEPVVQFEATDGSEVLTTIQQQLAALEATPLVREKFFQTVKDAIRLARERGKDRDGWVPVRLVYALVVLIRNLECDEFLAKPSSRTFREYSTAQFVFDLARFGRRGWSSDDQTLRGQTPNMATVSAGKSLTLPNLTEMDKLGDQFAWVRIEKGAGGTERNLSQTG